MSSVTRLSSLGSALYRMTGSGSTLVSRYSLLAVPGGPPMIPQASFGYSAWACSINWVAMSSGSRRTSTHPPGFPLASSRGVPGAPVGAGARVRIAQRETPESGPLAGHRDAAGTARADDADLRAGLPPREELAAQVLETSGRAGDQQTARRLRVG